MPNPTPGSINLKRSASAAAKVDCIAHDKRINKEARLYFLRFVQTHLITMINKVEQENDS